MVNISSHIKVSAFILILYEIFIGFKLDIWTLTVFLAGWIIDIDHQFDLYINYKQFVFNSTKAAEMHRKIRKLYILLHCYEWIIFLVLLTPILIPKMTLIFLIINYLIHLLLDTKYNRVRLFTYSFIYRFLNKFDNNHFIIEEDAK